MSCLDWALRGRPIPGEIESGDLHVVDDQGDRCVLGVIDGLGHGPAAAKAAQAAAQGAIGSRGDLESIFASCHASAKGTRGVAMSLAIVDVSGAMTWAGIGNVEAVVIKASGRESLTLRGGVVGERLTPPRVTPLTIAFGDVIVFFSDGLRTAAIAAVSRLDAPPVIAAALIDGFAKASDDALVLVARFTGSPA